MNSIPLLQPLQPVTRPTKAAGDISAGLGCRAGVRKDQQNIGMQNEFASVVSSSSTGAAMRLCHEATDIVGPKSMFDLTGQQALHIGTAAVSCPWQRSPSSAPPH
jgi:hypothetical protein